MLVKELTLIKDGKSLEQFEEALNASYSVESAEHLDLTYCGETIQGKYKKILYKDSAGRYWHETLVDSPNGWIDMETYLFGRRLPVLRQSRRK